MTVRRHRTALAALLVFVSVALPSVCWFVAGWVQAGTEGDRLVEQVQQQNNERIWRLAMGLKERLEKLRESESPRPFFHYQNLYHDPEGASQGPAIVRSPLSQGPGDPMILAYFQVDPAGRVTLPTLNDARPKLCAGWCEETQRKIKQRLCENGSCCKSLSSAVSASGPLAVHHLEQMDHAAWIQNLRADQLYAEIKPGGTALPVSAPQRADGSVAIRLGRFNWSTLHLDAESSLVALRQVATPAGTYTQGFIVDLKQVESWLHAADPTASFIDREAAPGESAMPLGSTGWKIAIDSGPALVAAREQAAQMRKRFLELFSVAVSIVSLAGIGVVMVVRQADQLAQQRSQFAAAAAHELRTPLAGMRMYGEMLAENLGDPARHLEYARRIASEAERLGRVVTNVNGFTRLERGSLKLNPQPGDLGAAVVQCVELQRAALERLGASVSLQIEPNLPAASFDHDALAQIVQNLLDNAEKYSRLGGGREIAISLESQNGSIELRVRDQGQGVAESLRKKLFEPFVRGGEPDAPAGLGLGLALARALARAQGGELTLGSGDRPGAEFVLSLPRADRSQEPLSA